ncbi:MAG: malto-oligosyltrehalose synthase [Desulfatibacillaceae bacterium]
MQAPIATYRIQFRPGFGFTEAGRIVPYLARLGVSHLYASPIFAARPGSPHGYDVVDPNRLNPELGDREDLFALVSELHNHGMGWIQDIVPNHMAWDGGNPFLREVLEFGLDSAHAPVFDIQWNHPHENLRGRVLAPFLGEPYARCLENGDLEISRSDGGFCVSCHDNVFPLNAAAAGELAGRTLSRLRKETAGDDPAVRMLEGIAGDFAGDKYPGETVGEARLRIKRAHGRFRELCENSETVRCILDDVLKEVNGSVGDSDGFSALDSLLARQHYLLAHWKLARREIDYRRFFDINDLICVAQENEGVFEATHGLIVELVNQNVFQGLRIDHVDGLADPAAYLERLVKEAPEAFILVEKILDTEEDLPGAWPVQGTTGYDFGAMVNGLFVNGGNEKAMDEIYTGFTGNPGAPDGVVRECRARALRHQFAGDFDNLARLLKRLSASHVQGVDMSAAALGEALAVVLCRFPVYRTYLCGEEVTEQDRAAVDHAVDQAVLFAPGLEREITFIRYLLLGEPRRGPARPDGPTQRTRAQFISRFQQLCAPLAAKGYEDTALYRHGRLLSLNEVGGDVSRFGVAPDEFHSFIRRRMRDWPNAMNGTGSHDSKRGEDVRARINHLSETPEAWAEAVSGWRDTNAGAKIRVDNREVPDPGEEYFLYQTLVGTWPLEEADGGPGYAERVGDYMVKAAREAKLNTSWVEPDQEYEAALRDFVSALVDTAGDNRFLSDFVPFCSKVARFGLYNSLATVLLKITAPGFPDFYQGAGFPDLSMVDPDNRRPVDFDSRGAALERIREVGAEDLRDMIEAPPGQGRAREAKLLLTSRALAARKRRAGLYQHGDYLPLETAGARADHVVAFARVLESGWHVVAVPRLPGSVVPDGGAPLGKAVWGDTVLRLPGNAPGRWRDEFTREVVDGAGELSVGALFSGFPCALIEGGLVR